VSAVRRHLNIMEDNLRDARRRVIAVYGEENEWNRNELFLRLLQDLLIVEDHLEMAMAEDGEEEKANDSGVSHRPPETSDDDEPPADDAAEIRGMVATLSSKARPQ
jgi:hypothetical protein